VINVVLSVTKFIVGVACHSSVLIADAGHSLSDLFSDFVTLWAVQVARLPPDQDHPYGHGKFEAVGSLFLSLTLIGTGIGVGAMANNNLLDILARQRRGTILAHQIPSLPALIMALVSVLSKEWLFRVTRSVGQRIQSQVVIANAWHHRSDAYSSILAFASIGVAMSIPGLVFVDAAAGLFVAAMIGMTGMEILGESVKQLTDTSNEELVQTVTKLANENADVEHVVRVRARHVGSASSVDVSVTMPEDRTASAARAVEERLKQQILQYVGDGVVDVDVRATAPPVLTTTLLNGDDDGTMKCTALESRATSNHPVSVEEIETCVRDEILRRHSDTVASIPVITVYYRDAISIDVDVHIRLVGPDDSTHAATTIIAATNIGKEVRLTLESSKQISKARIYLDLDN
jgi:cation diffusion facilitator family transporter